MTTGKRVKITATSRQEARKKAKRENPNYSVVGLHEITLYKIYIVRMKKRKRR